MNTARRHATGGRSTRQWMLSAYKMNGCADRFAGHDECLGTPASYAAYAGLPIREALAHFDVDHVDRAKKSPWNGNSRSLMPGGGLLEANSHDALLSEFEFTEPVCSPCHRRRTGSEGASTEKTSPGKW